MKKSVFSFGTDFSSSSILKFGSYQRGKRRSIKTMCCYHLHIDTPMIGFVVFPHWSLFFLIVLSSSSSSIIPLYYQKKDSLIKQKLYCLYQSSKGCLYLIIALVNQEQEFPLSRPIVVWYNFVSEQGEQHPTNLFVDWSYHRFCWYIRSLCPTNCVSYLMVLCIQKPFPEPIFQPV